VRFIPVRLANTIDAEESCTVGASVVTQWNESLGREFCLTSIINRYVRRPHQVNVAVRGKAVGGQAFEEPAAFASTDGGAPAILGKRSRYTHRQRECRVAPQHLWRMWRFRELFEIELHW